MITVEIFIELMGKIDRLIERLDVIEKKKAVKDPDFDWLDGADVMNLLNIRQRTLQAYRDQGILPFSKIGGKIFFKRSDIEAILEKNRLETY